MFPSPIIQIEKLMLMAHNLSKKHMSNIIYDFLLLNFFNIQIRKDRVVLFMDVIWQGLLSHGLEVNIDGATRSDLGFMCFIFKGSHGAYVGSFKLF